MFILTDGESTDGDPVLLWEDLKKIDVTIFSCLITSGNILTPKRLFDKPEKQWGSSHLSMFNCSSVVSNSKSAMSVLINKGWKLPESGESKLFAQVNHPDAIKEFCSILDHLSDIDAIAELIGEIILISILMPL